MFGNNSVKYILATLSWSKVGYSLAFKPVFKPVHMYMFSECIYVMWSSKISRKSETLISR